MSVETINEGLGYGASFRITGVASTAAGGQGEIDNPFGEDVWITDALLDIITPSDGAGNLSVGVAVTGNSATDIVNALAVGSVVADTLYNCFARQNTAKTEVTAPAKWTSAKKITITGSATLVGFEAVLHVKCVKRSQDFHA